MKKEATLSVKVPAQVHGRIKAVATKYGVSMATVVRWAIATYFEIEAPLPEMREAAEGTPND